MKKLFKQISFKKKSDKSTSADLEAPQDATKSDGVQDEFVKEFRESPRSFKLRKDAVAPVSAIKFDHKMSKNFDQENKSVTFKSVEVCDVQIETKAASQSNTSFSRNFLRSEQNYGGGELIKTKLVDPKVPKLMDGKSGASFGGFKSEIKPKFKSKDTDGFKSDKLNEISRVSPKPVGKCGPSSKFGTNISNTKDSKKFVVSKLTSMTNKIFKVTLNPILS